MSDRQHYQGGAYVCLPKYIEFYKTQDRLTTLDGDFTLEELRAIVLDVEEALRKLEEETP